MTKQDLFQAISTAADNGHICLFVGAGFSKAVLDLSDDETPSWLELLDSLFRKNSLVFTKEDFIGWSCPDIASKLVERVADLRKISKKEATITIKTQICEIFKYKIPKNDICSELQNILSVLNPRYIITTNYDFILEAIFSGIGYSLTNDECLVAPKNRIPIYHLHGTCQKTESIVITNEDYIKLFRPNDYHLEKLSLIMKESTVLFLGYAIGDQNVQMAIDWANNVYNIPFEYSNLIQFKWIKGKASENVHEENSLKILETNNLLETLKELSNFTKGNLTTIQENGEKIKELINLLIKNNEKIINDFIQNSDTRRNLIGKVKKYETDLINPFKIFIKSVYKVLWNRARNPGAFDAYDDMVKVLIDLLIGLYPIHPSLFISIVEEFSRFAEYVGRKYYGQSFAAYDTWESLCYKIPEDVCKQLKKYGFNHSFYIEQLMEERLKD